MDPGAQCDRGSHRSYSRDGAVHDARFDHFGMELAKGAITPVTLRKTGPVAARGETFGSLAGRVALGGYSPRAPTDPYVRNSRIRFFKS